MKLCSDCGQWKALTEFGENRSRGDGKAFYCRACFLLRAAASYRRRQARLGRVVREPVPVPPDHKHCPGCRQVKPLEDFHRAARQSGGRASYCKPCKRARDDERRLQREYGVTSQQLAVLVAKQGGKCALCRERLARHVDHDHLSGVVRGVFCFRCNSGLGQFADRIDLLGMAIHYLRGSTYQRARVTDGVYRLAAPVAAQRLSTDAGPPRALEELISRQR